MGIFALHPTEFTSVLGNLWEGVLIVDADCGVLYWNKAAEDITGYTAEEAVGRQCGRDFISHHTESEFLCGVGCPLAASLRDGEQRENKVFLRHKNGASVPIFARALPLRNADGTIRGAVQIFRRVEGPAETAGLLSELEKAAHTDSLTGAARREFGEKALEEALRNMADRGIVFGILLLDLDDFKCVNDSHGHAAGDEVLRGVVRDMRRSLRKSDLLIRWGGDEFLIVAPRLDMDGLILMAEKVRRVVTEGRYPYNDAVLSVGVSVGAVLPAPGEGLRSLLDRVDAYLYAAKRQGKTCAG